MAKKTYTTEEKDKIAKTIGAFTQSKEALATERLSTFIGYLSDDDIEQLDNLALFLSTHAKYYDNDKIKNILAPITMNEEFNRGYYNMIIARIGKTIPKWKEIAEEERNKKTPPKKQKTKIHTASLSENIETTKQTRTVSPKKASTQPLVILLSNIEKNNDKEYKNGIKITEDKDNGEKTTFNKKEFMVGDKSSVEYTSKDNKIQNKVMIDTEKENGLIFSHKKDSPIFINLIADTMSATIDHMVKTQQTPFVFNINSKTPEYLENVLKSLYKFLNDAKYKQYIVKNINKFKFNGSEISTKELEKAKTPEEFQQIFVELNKKAEEKKNAQNKNFEDATKKLKGKKDTETLEELLQSEISQKTK